MSFGQSSLGSSRSWRGVLSGSGSRALVSAPMNACQGPTASGIRGGLGAGQVDSTWNHREFIGITQEEFQERLLTLMPRG